MEPAPLERLDSFPYRHRLADVMTSPVVMVPANQRLGEAVRRMHEAGISSVLVEGDALGHASGIVTERDVLRAVATHGAAALAMPVSAFMSAPVWSLPPDVLLYRALGRMDRLGVRHLAVTDDSGACVGIVTARGLLRQRAGRALAIGDEISQARSAAEMAAIRARLPALARELQAEKVPPLDIAAVVSEVMRDLTARAAELAAEAMAAEGLGEAPAPWCVLILGSGGRGESLLAPDQDNALIHAGEAADDPWFAELGRRMCDILDAAGVPYCKGGIMASRPDWRHSEAGWRRRIESWIAAPAGSNLLNVDIFYDFQPVLGERRLAARLRAEALERAAAAPGFLRNLAQQLEDQHAPLTMFGGFRVEEGRVDLKLGGLWPVVAGVRVLALRYRIAHTATADRLAALAEAGHLNASDRAALVELHQCVAGLILDQQLVDLEIGLAPGTRVDVTRLDRPTRAHLKEVLRHIDTISAMVMDALPGR